MAERHLTINALEDLDSFGRIASILGIGTTLVDPDMKIVWINQHVTNSFGELGCGSDHCFAAYWGRDHRCADCLPLLVFRTAEAQEGLRVRGRPGRAQELYRVLAVPVYDGRGSLEWVLETILRLPNLGVEGARSAGTDPVLRELASTAGTAFLVVDRQDRIVSWSPAATAIFGYELDEVLGCRIDILVPPECRNELPLLMAQTERDGHVRRFETTRKAKDGRLLPVTISTIALRDEAGEVIGRSTVIEDRSELQHLREDLDTQRQLLAHVARETADAVLAIGLDGITASWNDGAERLFGFRSVETLGQPLGPLVGAEAVRTLIAKAEAEQTVRDLPSSWRNAAGVEVPVEISATLLRDSRDEAAGIAVVVRDARARRALERQMIRSEKLAAVGSLAAGLAHEIGTPLNVISATAEYIVPDLPPEHPARQELAIIVAEAERIGGMVRELLAFARDARPEKSAVRLDDAISRALSLIRIPVEKKTLVIERDVPADLPAVIAAPDGVHQILLNLLLNAVSAVEPGGLVRITASRVAPPPTAKDFVLIEIHDNGPGVPKELRERVFDPFFTTRAEGTGLGLAVCARIVEAHGGDIRVSDSPLGGACFSVQLPAAPQVSS